MGSLDGHRTLDHAPPAKAPAAPTLARALATAFTATLCCRMACLPWGVAAVLIQAPKRASLPLPHPPVPTKAQTQERAEEPDEGPAVSSAPDPVGLSRTLTHLLLTDPLPTLGPLAIEPQRAQRSAEIA